MSSKAYLVAEDDLTFMDQQKYRIGALAGAVQRAYNLGVASWDRVKVPLPEDKKYTNTPDIEALKAFIAAGGWPENLDVRQFQPTLDAGAAAAADFWNTAALAALGTEYSCLGAVPVAPAAARIKKIVTFFRVSIPTSPLPVNRLLFRRNAINGNLQAEFDLEQLACQQRVVGYFSEPVVWDNNTAYAVNALCSILTGVACKVIIDNFLVEPAGTVNV